MAEIEEEVKFTTQPDSMEYKTVTNGDTLFIHKLNLTQEQATSLAWLVNSSEELEFQVKVKK